MLRHATVAALSVGLLLAPCPLPAAPAEQPLAVPAAGELAGAASRPLPAPAAAPASAAADADALRAKAAALAERCKPVDYDPDLRARELADGVEPALAFVRDHVRFEAYPGAFRGAAGAYRARAANAADRSLLLAHLLGQKKVQTRFARGRLARPDAERLVARVFEPQAPAAATTNPPAGSAPAPGTRPAGEDFANRIRARALRDFAVVTAALGAEDAGGAAAAPTPAQLIEEVTPHVWVQARVGQEWVDLDASFPDAAPGKAYCPAERTSATLPDDAHQRVKVRVVTERLVAGALKAQTALELTRPAADLIDRHVFLLHAPAPRGGAAGALGGAGHDRWVPLLWIDGEMTQGKPVSFGDSGGGAGKKPGGAVDLFGGLPSGDPADAPAAPAAAGEPFVREVLEFELLLPGGRREVTRRVLCDRGGEAWRRTSPPDASALRPLPRNSRGPLAPQAIHSIWFSGGRHDLAALSEALALFTAPAPAAAPAADAERPPGEKAAGDAKAQDAPAPEPAAALAHQLWPISLQHLSIAFWGDHVFVPSLNTDPAVRFYLHSPRVLMLSAAPAAAAGDGGDRGDGFDLSIDLRRDVVRGVARDEAGAAAVRRGKIWYGLLGGALEHELAARQAAAAGADAAAVGSTSGSLLDGKVTVLRPGQAGAEAWEKLAGGRDVAARAAAALSAGETLVVPAGVLADAGGAEPAWWAVSAAGDTRAAWGHDLHASNWRLPSSNRLPPGSRGMQGGGWGSQRAYSVDHRQVQHGSRGRPGHGPRSPRSPRAGRASQEYLTLLEYVSMPISEAAGLSVGYAVFVGTAIATEVLLSAVLYDIASSGL